jgi:hypothetical protein
MPIPSNRGRGGGRPFRPFRHRGFHPYRKN